MFHSGPWATAYINTLEKEGLDYEDSVADLQILASWVKSLPGRNLGEVSGNSAAEKLEKLIRRGIAEMNDASFPAREIAIRFLILMVKKHALIHIDPVIGEIKRTLDRKNGIRTVTAEYALPPDKDFEIRIREAIKKQTGAKEVRYSGKVNADLIGGYKLRIGDTVIDTSIRSRLRKLEDHLIAQMEEADGT